jgi:hypothetical protein
MGQGILLLDIENFISHASGDERIRHHPHHDIVNATMTGLERIAQCFSIELQWRIAAFSFPWLSRNNTTEVNNAALNIQRVSLQMADQGYIVPPVHQGTDAADIIMTRLTLGLMEDSRIKVCILATEDGRGPFRKFVRGVHHRKKQVHLVGYRYIHPALQSLGHCGSSLLVEDVIQILEQNRPPISPHADPPQRTLAQSLRMRIRNPGAYIDPEHQQWINEALNAIEKFTQGVWEGTFWQLITGALTHWQEHTPPYEEYRAMMYVLVNNPRIFKTKSLIVYSPDGELLRNIRSDIS